MDVHGFCIHPLPHLPQAPVIPGVHWWRRHLGIVVCKVGHVVDGFEGWKDWRGYSLGIEGGPIH